MTYQVINPRILPRNFADAALGLAVGLAEIFVVFALLMPTAVTAIGVLTGSAIAAAITLGLLYLLLPVVVLLVTVWQLRIDAEGIEFVRALGSPKKIPWSSVTSIEEASQKEVVVRGWLTSFPPREATTSLSSIGHYRISWQGGSAYFPPADVEHFLYAVHTARVA